MVDFIDYIRRWISTKASNLLGNTIMTAAIITVTCYAVQKDVFESYSATKACLFSVLMCCIWCGLFNSIALFYSERDYLLDDLDKYLPVRTYVSANFFIQFFLSAVESVVCAFVFSLFFDFSSSGYIMGNRSLDFCVTFFLITLSADMLGFLMGMLINSITSIMTIIPVILISQLLLSGCLFDLHGVMEDAANITTARWGFYALGSIADLNSLLMPGQELSIFHADPAYIMYCWRYLFLLILICSLLSGIMLYFKMNRVEN